MCELPVAEATTSLSVVAMPAGAQAGEWVNERRRVDLWARHGGGWYIPAARG